MAYAFHDLPWLPEAPEDFRSRCRGLLASKGAVGAALQRLATHRVTPDQAAGFARVMAKLLQGSGQGDGQGTGTIAPLAPVALGILSNATMDLVADELPVAAARHGVALRTVLAPFDQVDQQALDERSTINEADLDFALIAVDHRWMRLDAPVLSGAPEAAVEAAIKRLESVVTALRRRRRASCILQTLPVPSLATFGSLDRRVAGSVRAMIEAANARILDLATATQSAVLDVAALAERAGTDLWFDPTPWLAYKLPFASACNAAYADMLGRLLGALRGKARKCLVLDLDNTLWGGVIGDDGLSGIMVGPGNALGEAFASIQRYALDLRARGIVLAVSSKNDDATAREPFRTHPGMLLREADIAVFQANWTDKGSNLEAIARALNIGLDALVVLDDNPAERALIRATVSAVAVPDLPADPAWFPWFLASAGYFEAVSFSDEDRLRADAYATDAQRADLLTAAHDLDAYIASLRMAMSAEPFDEASRPRVVQLINKTNQFNLTTRRATDADVAAAGADRAVHTLQVRLRDRFGDLGLIAVLIARPCPTRPCPTRPCPADLPTLLIDTWLMSCRVLGRRVEEAVLDRLAADARGAGVRRLRGWYRPTAKNGLVRDLYERLGFAPAGTTEDGAFFELDLDRWRPRDPPIEQVDAARFRAQG